MFQSLLWLDCKTILNYINLLVEKVFHFLSFQKQATNERQDHGPNTEDHRHNFVVSYLRTFDRGQ